MTKNCFIYHTYEDMFWVTCLARGYEFEGVDYARYAIASQSCSLIHVRPRVGIQGKLRMWRILTGRFKIIVSVFRILFLNLSVLGRTRLCHGSDQPFQGLGRVHARKITWATQIIFTRHPR